LLLTVDFFLCTVNKPGVPLLLTPPFLPLHAVLPFALKQVTHGTFKLQTIELYKNCLANFHLTYFSILKLIFFETEVRMVHKRKDAVQ
jgi:hypothetical protein